MAELQAAWRHCLVLGALNAAVPFWLIAWGEQHIDSGLAAVVQASVPIFNALIAAEVPPARAAERARARSGLAIGIVGVAVVTGIHPSGGWLAIAGALAVVALVALLRERRRLRAAARSPARPARSSPRARCSMGGLFLLPLALFQLPDERPELGGDRVDARADACSGRRSRS